MKGRRISITIVSFLFLLITGACLYNLFSVRKVEVNYAVSEKTDCVEIQNVLDGFLNSNILLLKEAEIEEAIKDFHYLEILSIEKSYPNLLKIELKERQEIYYLKHGDNYFVTTKDGFVLREASADEIENNLVRDKIVLELDGVVVTKAVVGQFIVTDSDALMSTVFNMAKSVNLTDCIKKVCVFKPNVPGANVTFETYSGVNIEIAKVENKGVEMAIEAFKAYDNASSDYVKMFSSIKVNLVDNVPKAVWTSSN